MGRRSRPIQQRDAGQLGGNRKEEDGWYSEGQRQGRELGAGRGPDGSSGSTMSLAEAGRGGLRAGARVDVLTALGKPPKQTGLALSKEVA